jgi:outer membrane protein assembly factor BamB
MSQPAIADGRLYMAFPAGGGHRLIAFELRSGRELWRVPIASDVISAPIAYGDSVFATTFDGTVYRFRSTDGGLAWREAYHATSAPWLWGDQVFVSHREDPSHAMLAPASRMLFGQSVSSSAPSQPVESVGRISTSSGASTQAGGGWHARSAPWLDPNVQNQSHYHHAQHESDTSVGFANAPATANAPAAAANIGQGTVRGMWEFQGSRPCIVDGRVFLTQGDHLVALDADSGHEIWSIPLHGVVTTEGGHLASPPAPAGGNLYLAGVAGEVVVVSQQDGRVLQTIHIGESMRFQPAIVGGRLFVGTTSGSLISLDLNDAHADGWSMWGGTAAHNGVQP